MSSKSKIGSSDRPFLKISSFLIPCTGHWMSVVLDLKQYAHSAFKYSVSEPPHGNSP